MRVNKCKPCGESSPYREWVERYGFPLLQTSQEEFVQHGTMRHLREEIAKGDPDTMAAPEHKDPERLLQAILDVIDEGGELVLTPRQHKAFQMIVREGVSYGQTAKTMRITKHAVEDLVKAGAKKLRILALTK